jgi:succinate dehydrogenase hydrophobic anchor subunit
VPRYLTLAALAGALCVTALSGELATGVLPALVVVVLVTADYALWEQRGRPWHDWTVILLLLPAILAAVWIAVGGLITDVERSDGARLALEVGPGVALVGLLCTLISYHGRHHPDE